MQGDAETAAPAAMDDAAAPAAAMETEMDDAAAPAAASATAAAASATPASASAAAVAAAAAAMDAAMDDADAAASASDAEMDDASDEASDEDDASDEDEASDEDVENGWCEKDNTWLLEHKHEAADGILFESIDAYIAAKRAAGSSSAIRVARAVARMIACDVGHTRALFTERLRLLLDSRFWVLRGRFLTAKALMDAMDAPPPPVLEDRFFVVVNGSVNKKASDCASLKALLALEKPVPHNRLHPESDDPYAEGETELTLIELLAEEREAALEYRRLASGLLGEAGHSQWLPTGKGGRAAHVELATAALMHVTRLLIARKQLRDADEKPMENVWHPAYSPSISTLDEDPISEELRKNLHGKRRIPGITMCNDETKAEHMKQSVRGKGAGKYYSVPKSGELRDAWLAAPTCCSAALVLLDLLHRLGGKYSVHRGINDPNVILSVALTMTALHAEDNLLAAANQMIAGCLKEWAILRVKAAAAFDARIDADPRLAAKVLGKRCYDGFDHGHEHERSITEGEVAVVQCSGQMVVTLAGSTWHTTTSSGPSVAEAFNCFYGTADAGIREHMIARGRKLEELYAAADAADRTILDPVIKTHRIINATYSKFFKFK